MTPTLVLSLFPGIGMLDTAFEEEGFCVVRGPDVLWGGDIRRFQPPPHKFDGVIGGPPCQAFSSSNRLVKARGGVPSGGNLIPEFERCVSEALPQWFLMENVKGAPLPAVNGYWVHSFLLNNRQLGEAQNRLRRWSFGWRGVRRQLQVDTVVFENPERTPCASTSLWSNGRQTGCKDHKHLELFKKWQGLPEEFDLPGFTVAGKVKAVVNGVPMAMGRAMAKAVRRVVEEQRT
jgi:DNA (cytosine-5)-methyltransferase 1